MKTIHAPSFLAILPLSTCLTSHSERNIPKGIGYSAAKESLKKVSKNNNHFIEEEK